MTSSLFNVFTQSPSQQLSMRGVLLDYDWPVPEGDPRWAVQVLQVSDGPWVLLESENSSSGTPDALIQSIGIAPRFMASILRHASQTLRTLDWDARKDEFLPGVHTFGRDADPPPCFPHLRSLTLRHVKMAEDDTSTLDALVGGHALRALHVETRAGLVFRCLAARGHIPTLETLTLMPLHIPERIDTTFLRKNCHLRTLNILWENEAGFIDQQILPLLRDFRSLTTLRLTWKAPFIEPTALKAIGSLRTLRRVWLSAGNQAGLKRDWLLDHASVRAALSPLQLLEALAFSRDSYENNARSVDGYYVQGIPLLGERFEDYLNDEEKAELDWDDGCSQRTLLKLAFERCHRLYMEEQAEAYAQCFPGLRWCYIGQLPMSIVEGCERGKSVREVEIQSDERIEWDRTVEPLKKMWRF
ncbi:hypothetical protein PLICRDRAFT_618620 [Plicaturopsis crispa FD-325 SS-3]|nr:hypothetical protein PLICRDRAFT_618620 [Plicaturopsis crispa FD-325 SS-3]